MQVKDPDEFACLRQRQRNSASGQRSCRAYRVTDRDQTWQHRRKTVFTAVGGEVELLKLALDWAIAGDDQAVAVSDRAAIRRLMAQRDPSAMLNGFAALLVEIGTRVGPLYGAVEVAAGMDPAARDLVEESQGRRLDDAQGGPATS